MRSSTSTSPAPTPAASNYGQYANPAYDAELDAAMKPSTRPARRPHAQGRGDPLADAPVAPLYFAASRNLVNPQLTGWVDNPSDSHGVALAVPAAGPAHGRGASAS